MFIDEVLSRRAKMKIAQQFIAGEKSFNKSVP